ncbi:glycoside hydrolase family 61 protein [Gelatoporia subvermispora B]|uniref:AA9 family lytic polysaccharide monooxygenase n=2 Tax=Ceriporiopsis subvermispora TaxID=42742 RepID=M2QX02_CERS8|nr:glycoside hydrolase family 61 protein [Gelatoporia subvermispora B]QHX39626.1 lytic polysaccharide monooxygenase 1 [Gelatoporia subvermispora]
MFAFAALLVVASATLPRALAHGGVLSYENAGNWYQGWAPYNSPVGQTTIQRPWSTYNPITDPTDPTLSCNDDGTSGALQLTATVQAGSAITAYWNQVWPHAYGPMLVYLAQCPGTTCTGVNSDTLSWFKIDQSGLINGTIGDGFWGDGLMIAQNSSWTTTIPSTVPSGNYLIRFETIALHSLPAQFYPECAQINIVGGGSLQPTAAELTTFPGAYSATDPGINCDLYTNEALTETTYVIPGPPLYGSSGSTSVAPAPPTSAPATSAPHAPTTISPPPVTTAPTSVAQQYGQCGGVGWSGPTACASGFTCTEQNSYYSQCL